MKTLSTITILGITTALSGCGEPADTTPQTPDREPEAPQSAAPSPERPTAAESGRQTAPDPEAGETAWVESTVVDTDGDRIGTLSIEPLEQGVRLSMHVEGLNPGPHAVHFHEHGRCNDPDFKSAGGHYNPHDARHGMPDMDEDMDDPDHHVGDMLNQEADDQGLLSAEMVNGTATLTGKRNALLDEDGSALVIHAQSDDYESQPAGDAGDRVACAVIDGEHTVSATG